MIDGVADARDAMIGGVAKRSFEVRARPEKYRDRARQNEKCCPGGYPRWSGGGCRAGCRAHDLLTGMELGPRGRRAELPFSVSNTIEANIFTPVQGRYVCVNSL